MEQYSRNMGILNQEEFLIVKKTKILVVGAGGLGGYIASSLVRLGVEQIIIIDFDNFEKSNLNRQIFSSTQTLNKSKVEVTKEKLLEINPSAKIKIMHLRYDNNIDKNLYNNIDIVFDAVDNIETKLLLEDHCTIYNKPLVHGAIGGWYGQMGIILPNAYILKDIYKDKVSGVEKILKSPTFIPGIVGNMMISEFLKFILKKESLVNKILFIDVLDHEYRVIYQK
jgi:molybdopterin/thiamine biosynthesis adenylyltransferase